VANGFQQMEKCADVDGGVLHDVSLGCDFCHALALELFLILGKGYF